MVLIKNFRRWWQRPRRLGERDHKRDISFLELFYDLVYVVIIIRLTNSFASDFGLHSLFPFVSMFLIIWWAWINGTLYHDFHGNDDIRSRFFTFSQMICVLFMAIFSHNAIGEGSVGFALSYGCFQLLLTLMWWRTGVHDKEHEPLAMPYAGIFLVNTLLWFGSIFVAAPRRYYIWAFTMILSLLLPFLIYTVICRRGEEVRKQLALANTASHSLVERFGLFTIIVLGEIFIGLVSQLSSHAMDLNYFLLGLASVVIAILIWGIYFDFVSEKTPNPGRNYFLGWAYMHLPLTLSIASISPALKNIIKFIEYPLTSEIKFMFIGSVISIMVCVAILIKLVEKEEIECHYTKKGTAALIFSALLLLLVSFPIQNYFMLLVVTIVCLIIPILIGFLTWLIESEDHHTFSDI